MSCSEGHRIATYYQTQYDWGHNAAYVSPLPLIGRVTHLYLSAFHINEGKADGQSVTLNDNPPDQVPYYEQMWKDIQQVQDSGITVLGMLGGAAMGTFGRLASDWDKYYPDLSKVISDYGLEGIDIDAEESTDIGTVIRLITQLKADFGSEFIVTLAPVATALTEGGNLSGFNYRELESQVGANISWYNAQFYSGFGSFFPDDLYVQITEHADGIFPPEKVVASVLTAPELGGGFTAVNDVVQALHDLVAVYGDDFGGIAGWEYFASLPGGWTAPWEWAETMQNALNNQTASFAPENQEAARQRIMDRASERHADASKAGVDIASQRNAPPLGRSASTPLVISDIFVAHRGHIYGESILKWT
ncbi:glycoside hydrolase family 18 protein [Auriculariales sp. MPI-PUGE-AT-0066]|nr:glycoside hydrolase family 18 protein [Auriculariales sp. MPI-PUGE-AT-0066]